MTARIFRPAKNAMQSGRGNTGIWLLEFEQQTPRGIEPLMGYTSSADMKQQVRLEFDSSQSAIAYCEKNGIDYRLQLPKSASRRRTSYAENFSYNRKTPWTQ